MKLLHPEVEITPGRAGKQPTTPNPDREKLDGSVILRLTNDTPQLNSYTIRLRCDQPFWQEAWYTLRSIVPLASSANTAADRPDIPGHNGRSLTVFVGRGGTRDILIRFNVPALPENRAGRYGYIIEVETKVTTPSEGGARRKDRLTSLPANANVRPFYKWSLDLTPESQRVGRRRRSGEFEVVVTNEGNDWLYCDLQLPRPKDLLLDCPTLRLAVPPPEPGEMLPSVGLEEGRPGVQRTVPLVATTRLKTFRGDLTPQPLSLSALRVDAPSLPPPPEDGFLSLGAVVANNTTEVKPCPSDRALVYAPPIPAKLVDFFSRGVGSFKSWIAPVLLLAVALPAAFIVAQHIWFAVKINNFGSVGTSNIAEAGKKLIISGKYVIGSHIQIVSSKGDVLYEEDSKEVKDTLRDMAQGGPKLDRCSITIPASLDHTSGKLVVQRLGAALPFLSFILPKDSKPIQIGSALVVQNPIVTPVDPGPYPVHGVVTIQGQNLGSSGFVLVGGQKAVKAIWSPTQITVTIPPTLPASPNPVDISVRLANGSPPLDAGGITIGLPVPAPVGVGKTAGGGTPAGTGKTAGGSAPAGGSKTAGTGKTAGGGPPASGGAPAGGGKTATGGGKTATGGGKTASGGNGHNPPPPFRPSLSALTAEDYLLRGQYDQAVSAVNGQDTAYAHAVKAIAYARRGDATNAAAEAVLADSRPQSPSETALTQAAHGWVAFDQKQWAQSQDAFSKATATNPSSLLIQFSRGAAQPDPTAAATQLHTMLQKPGLPAATKAAISAEYKKAYAKSLE